MKDFSGVFTALVTPFKNGEIDWVSFKRLMRQQLDGGVQGFVISGTTAESPTLSLDEKQKIFNFVKQESGGSVPLIVGTGSNSTSESIHLTIEAAKWGADAALVVVPYYNKPPQRGLFQHFQKISECSKLPVILYNVPGRTITRLDSQTIVELSHLPNIIGIKEATGDVAFGAELIRECPPDFLVISGDDGTFLDLTAAGGQGVISVAAHILPKEFSGWWTRARKGEDVTQEFSRIRDLNNYLYIEANPIPVKMALHLMGIIDSAEMRLPLTQLSEAFTLELKNKMQQAELL